MIYFVLGSHPELSQAEIESVLKVEGRRVRNILFVEETDLPLTYLQERLAGTIKIGTLVGLFAKWNKEEAADLIRAMVPNQDHKIQLGISAYGRGVEHHAKPLGLEVKKLLKEDGLSARLVTSRDPDLSAVVIEKNGLLDSGGEFVLIEDGKEILIGQTQTIQNFESWSHRDFGRPGRDAKSGMLPPKLARMMINLSGKDPRGSVLLDPFCGSGTVLTEAGLMGFKKIYGSDISEKAISDTKKNLEWMQTEASVQVADARSVVVPEKVDAIIAEPYLGPPQRGDESRAALLHTISELTELYIQVFAHLSTCMKAGAVLVAAFPVFKNNITITKPLPGFSQKKRFRYERPGQKVARDILVFERE